MSAVPAQPPATPRWLHCWAVLTVGAAFPLLFLGAEVTSRGVGMVDPHGLRTPWHFLHGFLEDKGLGWLIEHGHRLAGWVVGMCVIVLAIGLGLREPRRWVRWLGLAGFLGVALQGALGIFRIELNAVMGRTLAWIHGCFAQLVFALLVTLAVVTSRWWFLSPSPLWGEGLGVRGEVPCTVPPLTPNPSPQRGEGGDLRVCSLLMAGLVYIQLVLGGMLRHLDYVLIPRLHVLGAFAVVGMTMWLVKVAHDRGNVHLPLKLLVGLVVLQLVLGLEAWLARFTTVSPREGLVLEPLAVQADLLRSLHYVLGAVIFAASVVVALVAHRHAAWSPRPLGALGKQLEGAA